MQFQLKIRRRNTIIIAFLLIIATVIFGIIILITRTERIEYLNKMLVCSCGYSDVKFDDGKIWMVNYHHDDIKPGELIGYYHSDGKNVEISLKFKGKEYNNNYEIDSIGLMNNTGYSDQYQAINTHSIRYWIHIFANLMKRIVN